MDQEQEREGKIVRGEVFGEGTSTAFAHLQNRGNGKKDMLTAWTSTMKQIAGR